MDSIEDITSEHLHAKADEYEAAAKRYRAAAVALEDPETGQPKRRARRRAQSTNGTVTEDAVLKHLTPEGVKAADIRGKLRGSEAQVLRKLKSLEAAGKAKRTGERRTTRWHKVA
jgi:predicted Rossmann fold nucleotide-binding protein DprA/Smf involved in DNA uptake